jgi:hypothetical protein
MSVARLLSRANSTAQFTATVVVPTPPFAPKKTSVVVGERSPGAASSRAVIRRIASSMVSRAGGHVRNSLAPDRIDWRMRSGAASSATKKMVALGEATLTRSTVCIAVVTAFRPSTITMSDDTPSRGNRSSVTRTGTAANRSRAASCERKLLSSVTMRLVSRTMFTAPAE